MTTYQDKLVGIIERAKEINCQSQSTEEAVNKAIKLISIQFDWYNCLQCHSSESSSIHQDTFSFRTARAWNRKSKHISVSSLQELEQYKDKMDEYDCSYATLVKFIKERHKFKGGIRLPSTTYKTKIGGTGIELIIENNMLKIYSEKGWIQYGYSNTYTMFSSVLDSASYDVKVLLLSTDILINYLTKVLNEAEASYSNEMKIRATQVIKALSDL